MKENEEGARMLKRVPYLKESRGEGEELTWKHGIQQSI